MLAGSKVSSLKTTELPSSEDSHFLHDVAQILERLRSLCEWHGHPLLAALIDMAKSEANDDLKTYVQVARLSPGEVRHRKPVSDVDGESAARMAEKLAHREREAVEPDAKFRF